MKNKGIENFILDLYNDYYSYIYKLCLVKLRSSDDAHDCCQETFKTAIEKLLAKNEVIQNPRSWITTIAGFTIKSYLKKMAIRNYRHVELSKIDDEVYDDFLIDNLLEKIIEKNTDINSIISKIQNDLKQKDYDLYINFFKKGRSIQDISDELGISYQATATRTTRLKIKIKKILSTFIEK